MGEGGGIWQKHSIAIRLIHIICARTFLYPSIEINCITVVIVLGVTIANGQLIYCSNGDDGELSALSRWFEHLF